MTDNFFLTLNGTEAVWVDPRRSDGTLSFQWITTTQAIANLASNALGNTVPVTSSTYIVQPTDGTLLVDCVAAGSVPVIITLMSVSLAPRPVRVKKIDKNNLLQVIVVTADNSVIEYLAAGTPFVFSNPGECITFDPVNPIRTQYWITD